MCLALYRYGCTRRDPAILEAWHLQFSEHVDNERALSGPERLAPPAGK
jgi:hypothetical protein